MKLFTKSSRCKKSSKIRRQIAVPTLIPFLEPSELAREPIIESATLQTEEGNIMYNSNLQEYQIFSKGVWMNLHMNLTKTLPNEEEKEPIDTETKEESLQCAICMTNRKCMALSPCNHLCCCYGCVKQIDSCPLCREKIKSVKQIFI